MKFIYLAIPLLLISSVVSAQNTTTIKIPFHLAKGQVLFEKNCSACHGIKLQGSDKGPTLIHPFYNSSHHGDGSFYRAALKGVRAHHWNFGDMPAVPDMTEKKMNSIVPYIRFYQKQHGMH